MTLYVGICNGLAASETISDNYNDCKEKIEKYAGRTEIAFITLPNSIKEKVFREQLYKYRCEDALNHLSEIVEFDSNNYPEYINGISIENVIDEIIDNFEKRFDCNIDENSLYENAVYDALAGAIHISSCVLTLNDERKIEMHFTYDNLEENSYGAVYYDIFKNDNNYSGGQLEFDENTMKNFNNVLDSIEFLFDFIGYKGDYRVKSIETSEYPIM